MNIAALITQGGDARIAIDPATGVNQYSCPPLAGPDLLCLSSCTASPLSPRGLAAVIACENRLDHSEAAHQAEAAAIAARITAYFGVSDLAQALLAPSGTDATLLAMALIAAEHPGQPLISITATGSETGSGVIWAAGGRAFLGPAKGALLPGFSPRNLAISVALREAGGTPRPAAAISHALHIAAHRAPGRAVLHLVEGSKTGLCMALPIPPATEVIIDACQGRISAARVRAHLQRGWPVLITGSKFYGGPAFSGALLWPQSRRRVKPPPELMRPPSRGLLLRWHAALAEMEALAALGADQLTLRLQRLGREIANRIAATPGLAALPPGGRAGHQDWSDLPGIFSITLDGGAGPLNAAALRPLHRAMALRGVLLGQPVAISPHCAALRLAIGARDLIDPPSSAALDHAFAALAAAAFSRQGALTAAE